MQIKYLPFLTTSLSIFLFLILLLYNTNSQSFTPTTFSVSPNFAKSTSSLYIFNFNAITSFTSNFDIRVYFPSQFVISTVTGCGFWLNGNSVSSAQCTASTSTNQVVFTQLNISTEINNIRVQFNTTTARYAGSSTLIFYYYNTSTNTPINSLTNYVSLTIINAIMPCSIASTSNIVGDNITYSISYNPLVTIQSNSVLQVQMQPWGAFSQSNFITTNVSLICNGTCTLSVPASNGNISQLVIFNNLFSADKANVGVINLFRARNPASTSSITISLVILARISSNSQFSYMNCTSTFSVSTPNTFRLTNFATIVTNISASNIITLRLQLTNPISSISYLRIQPNSLSLTYQFNNYNQGTQPFQTTTSDGSVLLGNLTSSTTSSPSILTLNNFTLFNPPYANSPVSITITTQNLVGTSFFLIDRNTVDIIATPSTITQFGVTMSNTNINANTRYTLWFRNIKQLITTSFIIINFPSQVSLVGANCSLTGISAICIVNNRSTITVDINTILNAGTNITIIINSVTNPSTTTPTSSFVIITYYQDSASVVDQLLSGLTLTATSVPLRSVIITPASLVVGQLTNYTVMIQIANALPAGSVIQVKIPTDSFATTNVGFISFRTDTTAISTCTMSILSALFLQFSSSCIPNALPAFTTITISLSNITNPFSTKPTFSWQVITFFNSLQMQYLLSGIIVTMNAPAQITSYSIIPQSQIVNAQTTYQMDITFVYLHYNGDRIIINFPDEILLGTGFLCSANTVNVTVSCFQSSQTILQVMVMLDGVNSIGQISFRITSITNNWFSSTSTFTMQTTNNDTTFYYVQAGQNTVNFVSTTFAANALSNQQIILLGQSTVRLTFTSPFPLSRAINQSLIYLTIVIPTDLTIINSSCSLSYVSAYCAISGQNFNISGFGGFTTSLAVTFTANTNYFVSTAAFMSQLYYGNGLIATDSTMKLNSFCTNPCKQCTSTPTQCLSCLPTPYTVNNTFYSATSTCVNVCPITFFISSGQCTTCNQIACYSCSGTANNCTSCPSNKYLHQFSCLTTCPDQFYPQNGTCISCVQPCLTCTSANLCLTCTANYFLDIDSKCVLTCSNVSYIGLNNICQLCTSNCLTCSRTLSNCTSCVNQYLFFNNTCIRACQSGFYNNINSTCLPCVSPCSTCLSATICQTCITEYYLYNNITCTSTCPNGTLAVVNTCKTCNLKCATCSGTLSNCTSCATSYLFYLNQCLEICPPLTYPYNKRCTTCIQPCDTCSSSPQLCLSCLNNLYLLNNTCVTTCPTNGYYTSGSICLPCTQNCLTCASLATCDLCQSTYYLLSGGCISSCPDSHPIVSNRQCLSCSKQCATCSGTATNCTTCTVFYFKYSYTCLLQCPITYYSNTMTYTCEDGLSSRIVFFPVLITSIVVIFFLLVIKCFARQTSFITVVAAFMSPLELAIWCYVISLLFAVIKQPGITYIIPIILLGVSLLSYIMLSIIFFGVNTRKMSQDDYAQQWLTNNLNYTITIIIKISSLFLSCKFFRIIYSRLFNSIHLSITYKNRSNIFTITTIFTICFLIFSQIPAIVACWSLVYSKTLKDQTFYSSIQALIVTITAAIFSLLDIYKADNFFEESIFHKLKKYVQKVKDHSSMNKLQQGFDISHEEGSVDAQRFVGSSGGKLMYSKQKPQDIKDDFYFQQNDGKSQATDAIQKANKKSKNKPINIFAPIVQQQAQYYQNQKYPLQQINTQAQLQQLQHKNNQVQSDDEFQTQNIIQRRQQIGLQQGFDDSKSMLNQRECKKKWNNIIDKRMKLSQKIFNRHPPNLAQIDQPMMQDQNQDDDYNQNLHQHQNSTAKIIRQLQYDDQLNNNNNQYATQSKFNSTKRKKKRRKYKINKQLQQIYLQRLTDKKKSVKDMFSSQKSFKYDF